MCHHHHHQHHHLIHGRVSKFDWKITNTFMSFAPIEFGSKTSDIISIREVKRSKLTICWSNIWRTRTFVYLYLFCILLLNHKNFLLFFSIFLALKRRYCRTVAKSLLSLTGCVHCQSRVPYTDWVPCVMCHVFRIRVAFYLHFFFFVFTEFHQWIEFWINHWMWSAKRIFSDLKSNPVWFLIKWKMINRCNIDTRIPVFIFILYTQVTSHAWTFIYTWLLDSYRPFNVKFEYWAHFRSSCTKW